MKKVIEGKVYNTETATRICGYEYSNRTDFSYCTEDLYRTKRGAYFVAGEGGPLSKYAVSCGNNETSGSENIRVLTEQEAREFVERHGTADDYITAFGEPEEA